MQARHWFCHAIQCCFALEFTKSEGSTIWTLEDSRNIQGTFRELSGNIQGTFRELSGNIQGTFREHLGNIQGTLRTEGVHVGWCVVSRICTQRRILCSQTRKLFYINSSTGLVRSPPPPRGPRQLFEDPKALMDHTGPGIFTDMVRGRHGLRFSV
jgi:hypothetical protein